MPLPKAYGLKRGWPLAGGLGTYDPAVDGWVIFDFTVIATARKIGPRTRFIDTRAA